MPATMLNASGSLLQAQRSSLAGVSLRQHAQPCLRAQRQLARAETKTEEKSEKKEEKKPWTAPTLDSSWPSPIFGGSTGGLMRKAQVCLPIILLYLSRMRSSSLMSRSAD